MKIINDKLSASINFEIKTYEVDIAGHVNNIVYVKWLEDLRIKLFEQIILIDVLLKENLYPVVISTNIIYKKQLIITDKPLGNIGVENIAHNIMNLKFEFISNYKTCVVAVQKCILMDIKSATMNKGRLKTLVGIK
jgi:acyl-CoA thioester hydrolase